MNRHAYLIIAHHQFELLKMLIELLDFEQNDFYIHIDKKVRDFDFEGFSSVAKKSKIYFTDRINNTWGGFSSIQTELLLLRQAAKSDYSYFHLLSGVDLPLKKAGEIYGFFEKNQGKEFVHFTDQEFSKRRSTAERISLYHLFHEKAGRSGNFYSKLEGVSLALQRRLGVDRLRKSNINLYCGSNWISITHDFADYILSKQDYIKKVFGKSSCADELFVQTLLMESEFKDRLFLKSPKSDPAENMRYIDWTRGNPYVFKTGDFDDLMSCEYMFARKFDLETDREICQKIYSALK